MTAIPRLFIRILLTEYSVARTGYKLYFEVQQRQQVLTKLQLVLPDESQQQTVPLANARPGRRSRRRLTSVLR